MAITPSFRWRSCPHRVPHPNAGPPCPEMLHWNHSFLSRPPPKQWSSDRVRLWPQSRVVLRPDEMIQLSVKWEEHQVGSTYSQLRGNIEWWDRIRKRASMLRQKEGQHNNRRTGKNRTWLDDNVYRVHIRVARWVIKTEGSDIPAHPPEACSDSQCDGDVDG